MNASWRGAVALLTLATVGCVALVAALAAPDVLAAWRLGVILAVGLSHGSLMLVAIGRLLSNEWRDAVEDELLPAALVLPATVVLGLPLLLSTTEPATAFFGAATTPLQIAWFDPELRLARLAGVVAAWLIALALVARSRSAAANSVALVLANLGALFVIVDWMLLTQPFWWTRLFPFAVVVSQMSAALGFAFLVNGLANAREKEKAFRSLASALLALALLSGWIWFAQYLTAWAVNLPEEARWYRLRSDGAAGLLLAAAAALTLGVIAVLIVVRRHPAVLAGASLALVLAHGLHTLWWFRPAALSWTGIAATTPLAILWAAWFAVLLRAKRPAGSKPCPAQAGSYGQQ